MEGIGYWIFLLALYLISTLAKKRKQKRAWEVLDKEEENQEDPLSKPDFIELIKHINSQLLDAISELQEAWLTHWYLHPIWHLSSLYQP